MTEDGVSPLGTNIARYRKAEGLSAAELADRCGEGLTRSVIANLESGRKDDVTIKQLFALGNALGIPPTVFLVDLLDPGAPSGYPMPETPGVAFDFDSMTPSREANDPRNVDLLDWVTCDSLFLPDKPGGAASLVDSVLSGIRLYGLSWSRLQRALHAYNSLKTNGDQDQSINEEIQTRERSVTENAVQVIRSARELHRKGVELHISIPEVVAESLARVGISFDFDRDSREFQGLGDSRWS